MKNINYCSVVEPNEEKFCPYCGKKLPWAIEDIGYTTWAGSKEELEKCLMDKEK